MRLGEAVVDVRSQSVKRQASLQVPLRAGDFGSVQPSGDANLNALSPKPLRVLYRTSHRATKGDSFFELLSDLLSLQLRVQLGLMDLLNVDEYLAPGSVLDLQFELVDLSPFATDDDTGPRSVDDDLQPVGGALDIDVRNSGARKPRLQLLFELQVLVQQICVVSLGDPVRMPAAIEAQSESVRMNFLTHVASRQHRLKSALF